MKRLITGLIIAVLMNSVIAQTTTINESFETWPAPDWSLYELSDGGYWITSTLFGQDRGYGGGNAAEHKIANDNCDNWLVSPQINVANNSYELNFQEYSTDLAYYSYAGVYISTASGNPNDGDFVELSESLKVEGAWAQQIIDLSAYQGQDIYIAFVFQGTWHHWRVDEVVVSPATLIDGALTEIVNPVGINPVPSTENVIVTLQNYGTDTIHDADIEWRINAVPQTTYQGTNIGLAPGAETNITVGQYNFATDGDYIIALNLLLENDFNSSNDSIESTYYVSDPKDAALTDIKPEGYYPAAGIQDVIVTVLNNGDFDIDDINITWEVDGVAQTSFDTTSVALAAGEEINLTVGQYNFSNGLNEITATVNISADEDLSNNSNTSFVSINMLWESFEGEEFPPEMWNADDYPLRDYFFPPPHGDFYYVAQTDDNMFGEISDTLYTPLLNISAGDVISFWVNNSAFYTNDDKLIWKDGTTGAIHVIEDIDSQLEQWDNLSIDISAAAGINYIGFVNDHTGSFGTSSLDMITSTANIHHYEHDLGIRNLEFEYLAKINEVHTFNVALRNYGLNVVQGSSYSVKILNESDELLAEQDGVTLQSWEESIVGVEYTFTETDVLKVHAVIEYTADEMPDNNTSVEYSVYSVPSDILINDIGFPETVNLNIPFNTGGNTMSFGEDDLSQHLYYQDELNIEGYLYGVTIYYHELFGVGQYLPLQVWVKNTELEDLTEGWIPVEEMQMVFNDTIDVYPGHNSVYIPFDQPVLITGTNNLAIQYYQFEPSWPSTACRFKSTNADGPVRAISVLDVYNLDVNDPPESWAEHTNFTYTSFVFQPIDGDGTISGIVYDENNEPIEEATVEVKGTGILEHTDDNGEYWIPSLPYETYELTAAYLGYYDSTQTVVLNEEDETGVDFQLQPLPQVTVFGTVFGNNAPEIPLEGVLVAIDGYESLTTYTDANGAFLFENVYGAHEYSITYQLYGYHDQGDSLLIESSDVDLGVIILDEEFISAYNVKATPDGDQAMIEWLAPITSQSSKIQNDLGAIYSSYTNDPDETVWLGNWFENSELITVTSVEIYWDIYELAHDFVTVDIMDEQGNVLVTSEPFQTFNDSLMTIDVPNISIEGNYYVMVHWKNNPASTDALTIDYSDGILNTAYIKYPNEAPVLLQDFIGGPDGSFFVRSNILEENPESEARQVISYNIYKGLSNNIHEADQWTALNEAAIFDLYFVDKTWSNDDPQEYTYAIEAVYVEGGAEYTFSNFVAGYTNVLETENKDEVKIYPNPASSVLNISGIEGTTIIFYNLAGEILLTEVVETTTKQIDVSYFNNGIYFIRIEGLQESVIKKFIIAK